LFLAFTSFFFVFIAQRWRLEVGKRAIERQRGEKECGRVVKVVPLV
jgi:hypothetical protein